MSAIEAAAAAVARVETARAALLRARRLATALAVVLFAAAFAASVQVGEVSPARFVQGIGGLFNYIDRTLPLTTGDGVAADLLEWYWGFWTWLGLIGDTLVIAFLSTVLGAAGGFGLALAASRNLGAGPVGYFLARRALEVGRAVPELVYALVFVFAFGIGPLAGVLAITIHTAGALGKLFAEAIENIDDGPCEGLRAGGAGWAQIVRFGALPQVLPNLLSYALLRFEINVRGAAIIGFVGAGGIGQELYLVIRQFIYQDISAIVLMIIVTVALIDLASERVRHRLIGGEITQ
jgi:phosphonate transport system permease protein